MDLKVVVSGESIGRFTPEGCAACIDSVPAGELLILYDDGEYYPTFCAACIDQVVEEFTLRREEMADISATSED